MQVRFLPGALPIILYLKGKFAELSGTEWYLYEAEFRILAGVLLPNISTIFLSEWAQQRQSLPVAGRPQEHGAYTSG